MAYTTAVKAARMEAVRSAINAATPAGYVVIYTAAYAATLVTIAFTTDCGAVSGTDTLTFDCDPALQGTATGAGTAAIARIYDGDDTLIRDGLTVGTSGTNIVLNTTSIQVDDTIDITAGTIQHG